MMEQQTPDFSSPAQAIAWLVDMGADEIILDAPFDRFADSAKTATPQAKPLLSAQPKPAEIITQTLPLATATSHSSLAEITQALNFLEAHPLRKTASKLSFFEGKEQADVLIIADRPRNEEDKSGLVIAGKSRLLLTNMLAAISQPLEDVALMNLVPWRPPGNRMPTAAEVAAILPFILRSIELIKPKAILLFSALPGQYLVGADPSLARQRGKWLKLYGIDMIATFHPDELLKFPAHKKLAWRDLQNFRDKINE